MLIELCEVYIKDHHLDAIEEEKITGFMIHEYGAFLADHLKDEFEHIVSCLDATDFLSCHSRLEVARSTPALFRGSIEKFIDDEIAGLMQHKQDYTKALKDHLLEQIEFMKSEVIDCE